MPDPLSLLLAAVLMLALGALAAIVIDRLETK